MYRISCMAARAICRWGWCLVDYWLWRGGLEGVRRVAADLLTMAGRGYRSAMPVGCVGDRHVAACSHRLILYLL